MAAGEAEIAMSTRIVCHWAFIYVGQSESVFKWGHDQIISCPDVEQVPGKKLLVARRGTVLGLGWQ